MDDITDYLNLEMLQSGAGLGINLEKVRANGVSIKSLLQRDTMWYVSKKYPHFLYNKYDFNDAKNIMFYKEFDRRIDAERYVLECFSKCPDGNWELAIKAKESLETLEEDHPEWLV